MNQAQSREIGSLLLKAHRILLTTHVNPDGDGIGSGLALMNELLRLGKKVDFINRDSMPKIYSFLPNSAKIKTSKKITACYDVVVVLECPDLSRNGNIIDYDRQCGKIINIDHHLGNAMYGHINVVEPKAAAVGVQIYQLMKELKWKIIPEVAACIYAAVVTDTGSFRYSNTTPQVHRMAAELLELGAVPERICSEVYATSKESTRLFCEMLSVMKLEDKFGYSYLTRAMFKKTGADESETDNFINTIRSIKGIEISILFKETAKGGVKASFRSKNTTDVNKLAKKFGGGGHMHAAGCVIDKPLKTAIAMVVKEVRKYYKSK